MAEAVEAWGSTAEERAASFPCDDLIDGDHRVLYRAIDIDAPGADVFRWLCQLRVAPYSYDWIDNLGRRSPRSLTQGLDQLEVGQRAMTIFQVAAFEQGRSITFRSESALFGHVVVSYVVVPVDDDGSRLVVKLAFKEPPGPYGWLARKVLPAGDLVMMRKQLRTLRSLAERTAR